jgi:uncharacterized delta-60 repeat protein
VFCVYRLFIPVVLLYSSLLHAAPGDLDTTFGGGQGWVSEGFLGSSGNATGQDVIQQADGKLVVAGSSLTTNNYYSNHNNSDFALVRYNVDGTLDTTFDGDGKLTTAIGAGNDYGRSVIQQADGKLVVAGYSDNGSNSDFALVRYNVDGSLDTSFDGDGIVTTAIGISASASSVVQQADGKLVAAGTSNNGSNYDFALVRYTSDGSLDAAFSGDGKLTTAIGTLTDYALSVIQQADGKLVAAGYNYGGPSAYNFALVRYNSDGSLDAGFDGDGKLTTAIGGGDERAYAVIQQTDGQLLVVGNGYAGGISGFALVRYNPDGALDTTFDDDGKLTTAVHTLSADKGQAIVQQADGKLVVAGNLGGISGFGLVRYNPDGSLDTSFDGDGKLTTAIGISASASSVIQQADGKLVVAGASHNGSDNDFALVRYNLDGSLDTSFDGDGKLTTAVGAGNDNASSLIQQTDGKLVAAGASYNGSNNDFALVRYNSDGSLDTTFSGDGKLTTAVGASNNYALSVTQQADGKLVATARINSFNNYFNLLRYNADGSLDTSFDGDGKLTTMIGTVSDYASSVIQQTDGKLVAAGSSYNGNNYDFALVRYNANGSLDTTFSGDGKLTTPVGGSTDEAYSVIQQADGKLVVAGYSWNTNGAGNDFALVRYNSNGLLDTTFSGDGRLVTVIGIPSDAAANAVIEQTDGKLVVVGYDTGLPMKGTEFMVLRYESGQVDTDADGVVDWLDNDNDNDGVPNNTDDLPLNASESVDTDRDGIGNNADTNDDNDSLADAADAFPLDSAEWLDTDSDGIGNNADPDDDNDSILDTSDALPLNPTESVDNDRDGIGDNADTDDDNDSVADAGDNCPLASNTSQIDTDGDSQGDACDSDDDSDGKLDGSDNCPLVINSAQVNTDGDSEGDACDVDDDNDGIADTGDNCPLIRSADQFDWDGDGVGNICEADDDNDGIVDADDNCRSVANQEQTDSDGNGVGDVCEVIRSGEVAKGLQNSSVATADMNNDGFADMLIGLPLADRKTLEGDKTVVLKDVGSITIVSGADGSTLKTFYGAVAGEQFGRAVAIYPDVDEDGTPELVVGNPLADPFLENSGYGPPGIFKDAGNVSLYSGTDGALIMSIANGSQRGENFGAAVAVSPVGELVVGSPLFDMATYMGGKQYKWKDAGSVTVYDDIYDTSWGYSTLSDQLQANARYGAAVGWTGSQLMVGSPGFDVLAPTKKADVGMVEFYDVYGLEALIIIHGTTKGDRLGAGLSSFNQDTNGDSNPDWAVGVPGADIIDAGTGKMLKDAGKVLVFSGTAADTPIAQRRGTVAGDNLGAALAAGADINGDGLNDLLVSAPKADVPVTVNGKPKRLKDAGEFRIFSGADL